MRFQELDVPGVFLVEPVRRGDARGYFSEIFRVDLFAAAIGSFQFVQDNQSLSAEINTIRGLHFQAPGHAQGKLVRVLAGAILDVAVDIRHGSPTFGRHVREILSADNGHQLWIPPGFAHGFATRTPNVIVAYKVTDFYSAADDRGLAWDDPDLAIDWGTPADEAVLSDKDRRHARLDQLPTYFTYP